MKERKHTMTHPKFTVITLLAVNSIKQQPVLKGQYYVLQSNHFKSKSACIEQPPDLKDHFPILLTGFLRQGLLYLDTNLK